MLYSVHIDRVCEICGYRYETLFLPALQKSRISVPLCHAPLDIQWIWHCHMLAPLQYQQDMMKLIGVVPDHAVMSTEELHDKHKSKSAAATPYETSAEVRTMWNRFVSVRLLF